VRVSADGSSEKGTDAPEIIASGPDRRLSARDRPVADVIDRIRPWFNGRILVVDANVGRQRVTGVFDAGDPPRALQALVGPQGGRVTHVTPWLLIVTKE
jgi:transmembrane sensor